MRFILSVLFTFFIMMQTTTFAAETIMDATEITYDKNNETVIASGGVIVAQGGQTLEADRVIYNIADDIAMAEGNIILTDENGDTHYADMMELSDNMRRGVVENIYSVLDDGSRLWADRAIRRSEEEHVLSDARYTPCKACETNPDKTPPWALRASSVKHDKQDATMSYEDVRFEAWGVPVLYAPYFSHPDGTVKQKSGFLAPDIGFGSDYGMNFMSPYYWAISPSMDVTAGLRIFTRAAPQLNLEARKRYKDAEVNIVTSATYSERTDRLDGREVYRDESFRGHIEIDSLWNINNRWRAGTDIELASDEQYLDQYDIDDDDVLVNRIYAERFEDRDYSSVQLLAFQDLRIDTDVDQPNALPLAEMSIVGKPNAIAGGRYKWDSSFLTLYRPNDDQDVARLSSELAWQKQAVLPVGLTTKVDVSVRGDAYYTMDRDVAKVDPTENDNKMDGRVIPTASVEVGYPLYKNLETSQIRIKPRVGMTARPDVDNDSDIPNEDSIDSQINYTNLFEKDRFTGLDRVEDRTRVSYGVEAGYYHENGDQATAALGQSYRLDNKDNPFQNGSGFENQQSDIVGQVGISMNNGTDNMNYRFQLDGQELYAERHELYGGTTIGKTRVSAIYLYEKGSAGTEFPDSRQQIRAGVNYQANENWSVAANALYDLGEDEGLRQSVIGVGYDDDCYGVTAELQRSLQRESTGANDTTVLLRFRLKNLGEFETTAYDTGDDTDLDEDEDTNL